MGKSSHFRSLYAGGTFPANSVINVKAPIPGTVFSRTSFVMGAIAITVVPPLWETDAE